MTATHSIIDDLGTIGPLIDGQWLEKTSAGTVEKVNPSTGKVNGAVALAGAAEVDAAVAAAKAAYPAWRATPPGQRRRILQRIEQLLEEAAPEIGALTSLEVGVPIGLSTGLTNMAARWFGYYAGWADKLEGATIPHNGSYTTGLDYTLVEPYGVVGIILTWNGPISSVGMKIAPALAAGNCVVVKSPDMGPYAVARFAKLALEAGLPPGVLHMLPGGAEAGERLVRHPDVGKISFTGGLPTARKILDAARHTIKPVITELGGKTANIVFPDADLSAAVAESVRSCFSISGQGCNLNTRLLVHHDVYELVVKNAVEQVTELRVGDPFTDGVKLGPVINQAARARILGIIDQAAADGARIVSGGRAVEKSELDSAIKDGYYFEPTVLVDVDPYSDVAQNEIFGPVLAITPFSTEEEAITLANSTDYGLGTALQTRDITRVHRMIPLLQSGNVHVNGSSGQPPGAPFGGYKFSGVGREGGKEGIYEFLQTKNVFINVTAE